MDNAAGLPDGTEVRLNGIIIGYLEAPRLTESRDPKRAVEFDMMVKPEYLAQIPEDSAVAIAASNLLGGKFIDITKGSVREHREAGRRTALRPGRRTSRN